MFLGYRVLSPHNSQAVQESDINLQDSAWWIQAVGVHDVSVQGPFNPEAKVTRLDIAYYCYRLAGSPVATELGLEPFRDIGRSETGYREVMWLRGRGIEFGEYDANFGKDKLVTRANFVAYLYRMLKVALQTRRGIQSAASESLALETFSDLDAESRYLKEIAWAVEQNLLTADFFAANSIKGQKFMPDQDVTQLEAAKLLHQAELLFQT